MDIYGTEDIVVMDEINHIRHNTGMYLGSTETATRLAEELIDNALDEVQAGYSDIIGVFIDTENKEFRVLDNGRGMPFDPDLPEEEDPPISTSLKLFSSGKFNKDKKDSAYKIASGLHGIGNTAVNAVSEYFEIDIYRDGKRGTYSFKNTSDYSRKFETYNGNPPYSTKVTVKPSSKYFNDTGVDLDVIEEKLRIACSNYPKLRIVYRVDGNDVVINTDRNDLIKYYLTKHIDNIEWFEFTVKKGPEECFLKIGWDDHPPIATKSFTCVNLVRVHSGVHITKLTNELKSVFERIGKKHKAEYIPEDCLANLRIFMDLKLIKTSFEAQVKVKLESKSDLSVLDKILNRELFNYFSKNKEIRDKLIERFELRRKSIQNRALKIEKGNGTGTKRGSTKFTKLSDCKSRKNSELIIGEGDSAIGGLIQVRDKKHHAILPLRGVIPNAMMKKTDELIKNKEIKDIVNAVGTGILDNCNIKKLRYDKILLAADADPAGRFITVLLIALFAKLTPDIIKNGNLYICIIPLYGVRRNKKLVPIWTTNERKEASNKGEKIYRFKGLGEFLPKDLKRLILDKNTRKIRKVTWTSNIDKITDLLTLSSEKRKLAMGEWKIEED